MIKLSFLFFLLVNTTLATFIQPIAYDSISNVDVSSLINGGSLTLVSDGISPSFAILDYGVSNSGFPSFTIDELAGDTSLFEVRFSEGRPLLDQEWSDGTLGMAAAMEPSRVMRYNISSTGKFQHRLIQGSQRWQKITLFSSGKLVISNVGIVSSVRIVSSSLLPGFFSCSEPIFNNIWEAGALTLQLTEIPANSIPNYWEISSDNGVKIEGLAPQPYFYYSAFFLMNYNLEFDVKVIKGGFGAMVLSNTLVEGVYINVDVEKDIVSAHGGWPIMNFAALASRSLNNSVSLTGWNHVQITVAMTDISISINGIPSLSFSQYLFFAGSFGVGTSPYHSSYFKNINATSPSGENIYFSSFLDESVLEDFVVGTNPLPVVVDGARRDRISYAGDLDLSSPSAYASTNGIEYIKGTLTLLKSYQLPIGFFVPNVKIQQSPLSFRIPVNVTGLIGYSFNLISAVGGYYMQTGDNNFARDWVDSISSFFNWAHSQVDTNGLFNISDPTLGGDWNYYDPVQVGAVTKFNSLYAYSLQTVIPLLKGVGENGLAEQYQQQVNNLQQNINKYLWNENLGAYSLSNTITDVISQDANSLAILSNIPSSSSRVLSSLKSQLFVTNGALAFSNSSLSYGFQQKISPYASGYHLNAAFYVNDTETVNHLLYTMWGLMVSKDNINSTGTLWEVLNPDGSPGIDAGTSLCHAWATAPTGALSKYVLGIKPILPGYVSFSISPQTLNLDWAFGKHPTPLGDISVSWKYNNNTNLDLFEMIVSTPNNSSGTIYLPPKLRIPLSSTSFLVNGKTSGFPLQVSGGMTIEIKQVYNDDHSSFSPGIFDSYSFLVHIGLLSLCMFL